MEGINDPKLSNVQAPGIQKVGEEKQFTSEQNQQNGLIQAAVCGALLEKKDATSPSTIIQHNISPDAPANQKPIVLDQTTSTFEKAVKNQPVTVQTIDYPEAKMYATAATLTPEGVYQPEYLNKLSKEERAEIEAQKIGYAPEGQPFVFKDDQSRDLFFKMKDEGKLKFFGDEGFSAAFMERTKDMKPEDSIVFNDEAEWQNFNKEVAVVADANRMATSTPVVNNKTTESVAESTESPPLTEKEIQNIPPAYLESMEKMLLEKLISPPPLGKESQTAISILLKAVMDTKIEKKRAEEKQANAERVKDDVERQELKSEYLKKLNATDKNLTAEVTHLEMEEVVDARKTTVEQTIDYIKYRAYSAARGIEVTETIFRQILLLLDDMKKHLNDENLK